MKKLFYKKLISLSLVFCLMGGAFGFAQEEEEEDDFDAMFAEATGDVEVEQSAPVLPAAGSSGLSSLIGLSGHFDADLGLSALILDKPDFGGYLSLNNSLYMNVSPNPVVSIHGGIGTSLSNKFSLGLSHIYFDYLLFDRIFISAGLKGVSWGYVRMMSEGNVMADTNGMLNAEVRYPWSTGTFTFVGAYNYAALTPNPSYTNITMAASLEQTIGHTSVNLFGKKYGNSEKKSPLAGLEVKRTIFGFDTYAQGVVRFNNLKKLDSKAGYQNVCAIAGFYRLWDGFDPNIGINIEYNYVYIPNPSKDEKAHNNKIALQWGIKRIGKNKNMKGAIDWNHNFTSGDGNLVAAYIFDGILPYASWRNAVSVDYGRSYKRPQFKMATTISLSLDY
ncbi:MAG: hypothetical protein K5907_03955 [Treponema sp.]|nr:hypothetical protein [Treponema sp.]